LDEMFQPAATPKVRFLCAGIGRGHPHYLDGLQVALRSMLPSGFRLESLTVAEASHPLGRVVWQGIEFLYRRGSSPGPWSGIYGRLRRNNDYNLETLPIRMLRRTLPREFVRGDSSPIVVSHPVLAASLRPHPRVYYQHGEAVTPAEAVVTGACRVFVPTAEAGQPFTAAGYDDSQVIVTGLCIEPSLAAMGEACFARRCERLRQPDELVGAFFSSGAEPALHIRTIGEAVQSAVSSGGRAMVFAPRDGRLHAVARDLARNLESRCSDRLSPIAYDSHAELDRLTAERFEQFDYFVAPPHERSLWALGLGLPMFLVGPDIGPFAPLNRDLLLKRGVALPIEKAGNFGETAKQLRARGEMERMAQRGVGHYSTLGFAQAARILARDLSAG